MGLAPALLRKASIAMNIPVFLDYYCVLQHGESMVAGNRCCEKLVLTATSTNGNEYIFKFYSIPSIDDSIQVWNRQIAFAEKLRANGIKTPQYYQTNNKYTVVFEITISAFAADDAVASGTIPDSKITWELDGKGWLTISGSGDCSAFTSKDDQPWAEYRSQITQVWFDGMESLAIPDLAYWFEDCTSLTTAEIPSTTPVIGRHAFYNCPLLTKLSIYYGEHTLDSIGEDAFWRETDNGDTLYVAYIIGYPESTVPFYTYDWAASNRSDRYFYDLYGVYQNADAATAGGIKKAPAQVSTRASTGIVGTCPSCKQYSLQGTYVEQTHTSRGHQEYYECYSATCF